MADEQSPELAGLTIGQYALIRELGQGGMATVYLAQQTSIGRKVAIKVLPDHLLKDQTFMQRFVQEVKVIADLQHPRVLPVYDFGELAGRPYIVTAYMGGGTLADRLRGGLPPLPDVVRLVEQAAEGLDHAHRKGVIHRDFKPSNVLLDEHGNAYLADFGIAKVAESAVNLTGSNVVGTPAYMAPELSAGQAIGPTIDVYALGITVYQMLTGDVPFRADTPVQVMMAHNTETVPDITSVRPDLPPALAAVMWRALAKEPAERYPTAGALAADLRRVLASAGAVSAEADTDIMKPVQAAPATLPQVDTDPGYATAGVDAPPSVGAGEAWQSPGTGTLAGTDTDAFAGEDANPGCSWGLWAVIGGFLALIALAAGALWALFNGWGPFSDLVGSESPFRGGAVSEGGVRLAVTNGLDETICEVQIKLSLNPDWADNQLADDRQIPPGETYTISRIPPGEYDYRALNCDRDVLGVHYSVVLLSDEVDWALYPATSTLEVVNESRQTVCSLYVSAPVEGAWRGDKLGGGESLPPGDSFDVAVAAGAWDLRAEACDGGVWEAFDLSIEGKGEWVLTDLDMVQE